MSELLDRYFRACVASLGLRRDGVIRESWMSDVYVMVWLCEPAIFATGSAVQLRLPSVLCGYVKLAEGF